jgi:hypothetical protein
MAGGDAAEQFDGGVRRGSRTEYELRFRLVCRSAHQRYQDAQNWMARRYRFGFAPREVDLVQAYKWYQIAFYGEETAEKKRAELMPKMTPAQITEAQRLVAEWEPNPAECDDLAAQANN